MEIFREHTSLVHVLILLAKRISYVFPIIPAVSLDKINKYVTMLVNIYLPKLNLFYLKILIEQIFA
jgi:hypothetical protein